MGINQNKGCNRIRKVIAEERAEVGLERLESLATNSGVSG
jgi:hypothetical protein